MNLQPEFRNPREGRNPKAELLLNRVNSGFGFRISHFGFSSKKPSSGFTLIELVISSALAAMILVAAYMCLNACMASQKLIEPRAEVTQNARTALAIMTADLRTACPLSKDFDFLGMDRMLEEVEADNLDFATHNYFPRRPGEGDFCEVSYFLEKDKAGKFNLWRRRNPTIALDPLSGGTREEIARELLGLRFEYYDGFDWYDDWGQFEPRKKEKDPLLEPSNLSGMPEAVRITLSFDSNPGKRRASADAETVASEPALVFKTVVRLELTGRSAEPSIADGGGGKGTPSANLGSQPN